jgi:hypothetical protein
LFDDTNIQVGSDKVMSAANLLIEVFGKYFKAGPGLTFDPGPIDPHDCRLGVGVQA